MKYTMLLATLLASLNAYGANERNQGSMGLVAMEAHRDIREARSELAAISELRDSRRIKTEAANERARKAAEKKPAPQPQAVTVAQAKNAR